MNGLDSTSRDLQHLTKYGMMEYFENWTSDDITSSPPRARSSIAKISVAPKMFSLNRARQLHDADLRYYRVPSYSISLPWHVGQWLPCPLSILPCPGPAWAAVVYNISIITAQSGEQYRDYNGPRFLIESLDSICFIWFFVILGPMNHTFASNQRSVNVGGSMASTILLRVPRPV